MSIMCFELRIIAELGLVICFDKRLHGMKLKYLHGLLTASLLLVGVVQAEVIYDKSRERNIPFQLSYPIGKEACSVNQKCPVAFLSAGYGVPHTMYAFLSEPLNELGYMVIAVAHELPQDPPLSVTGNLYETRSENWTRGADTLGFLKGKLESRYPEYDFDALLLLGHSNGGDISAWLGNEGKPYIKSIITLDHRRVPLPRNEEMRILSIRGSDYPADKGVLPIDGESAADSICVVQIPGSRHNDMSDAGPVWLKEKIAGLVTDFLNGVGCVR